MGGRPPRAFHSVKWTAFGTFRSVKRTVFGAFRAVKWTVLDVSFSTYVLPLYWYVLICHDILK